MSTLNDSRFSLTASLRKVVKEKEVECRRVHNALDKANSKLNSMSKVIIRSESIYDQILHQSAINVFSMMIAGLILDECG